MGHIEEVAARLKGLREALGLSVADVCAACGIEEEKYTAYEHGTTGIPVSTAKRIAEAYGVEIMALLFGEEPKMNNSTSRAKVAERQWNAATGTNTNRLPPDFPTARWSHFWSPCSLTPPQRCI